MCITFEGQKVNLSKCYDKNKDEDAGLYCIIELLQNLNNSYRPFNAGLCTRPEFSLPQGQIKRAWKNFILLYLEQCFPYFWGP